MDIHSDTYEVAPLDSKNEAVEVIRQAERAIADITGRNVTLIAYSKTEEDPARG